MARIISKLETVVATELSFILGDAPVPSTLSVEPSAKFLSALERYIPQLLSSHYPEWAYESLDGFFLANAQKIGSETAEFSGLCILISDQSETPFFIRLTLASSRDSIASYQVMLGKSGGKQPHRSYVSGDTANL